MNEKKYVGNGRKNVQYDFINCQIEIDKLFKQIYADTNNSEIKKAFEILVNASKDLQYFNNFSRKGGKKGLSLNITISARKEIDNFKNTHSITLNEFVPKQNNQNTPQPQQTDDLPF